MPMPGGHSLGELGQGCSGGGEVPPLQGAQRMPSHHLLDG